MQEILPEGDWSQNNMKLFINNITKRLERIFVKVHKQTLVRVSMNFNLDYLLVFLVHQVTRFRVAVML